jgi:hypothetical protein
MSYTYNNIVLNGNLRLPIQGQISVNDPNLNMNFDGLDLSNKDNKYDFHINVENADYRLKLVKIQFQFFKGDVVVVQVSENTIENLEG